MKLFGSSDQEQGKSKYIGVFSSALTITVIGLLALEGVGCNKNNSSTSGNPANTGNSNTTKIAVIPKGTNHEYWKSVHAGAVEAVKELKAKGRNIEIFWKGPVREDDRNGQIEVVETFRTQKVNGIVLAPLDSKALVRPVEACIDNKIPVVIMDSALDSSKQASTVATDNYKAGKLGGEALAKLLNGKGNVILLRYEVGSASTEQREAGFLDAMKAQPGIKVVSSDQYGGTTVEKCFQTAQNILRRHSQEVNGIFSSNETTTRGMRLALKDISLLGKVKFVGFDSSPDLVTALKSKEIDGLVVQDPFKMGYTSVNTMVDVIDGKAPAKSIDTGEALITPANMNDPKMDKLLNPPTEQ